MRKRSTCPICAAAPSVDYAPFCSRGCRDRDMLQWLGNGYRVPGPAIDPNDNHGLDSRDDAP